MTWSTMCAAGHPDVCVALSYPCTNKAHARPETQRARSERLLAEAAERRRTLEHDEHARRQLPNTLIDTTPPAEPASEPRPWDTLKTPKRGRPSMDALLAREGVLDRLAEHPGALQRVARFAGPTGAHQQAHKLAAVPELADFEFVARRPTPTTSELHARYQPPEGDAPQ